MFLVVSTSSVPINGRRREPMPALSINRPPNKPLIAYPQIPPDIYEKLRIRAKTHFRSIKAEVEFIITEAVIADERGGQQWLPEMERK
jgi:hypothetical protein